MTVEATVPKSRRALLGAALGALAATVAQALGRPAATLAANGDPVTVGSSTQGTLTTQISNIANNAQVFIGSSSLGGVGVTGSSQDGEGVLGSSATGVGVHGSSLSGIAVLGESTILNGTAIGVRGEAISNAGIGVFGFALRTTGSTIGTAGQAESPAGRGVFGQAAGGTGVHGWAGDGTVPAPATKTGVYGRADVDSNARGVSGYSAPGTGVYGATNNGAALLGLAGSSAGFGLKSTGRVSLSKASGVATIPNGGTSVTFAPGNDIVTGTYVLLTPQAYPGGRSFWATTDTGANTITIRASSAVGADLKVAWLALG
jgi:hypothetical protein